MNKFVSLHPLISRTSTQKAADRTTICFEPWQKPSARLGSCKTGLSPPPNILILTVPRRYLERYFCCGFLLLLVLAARIYTLVQLLCLCHILVNFKLLNDHLSGKELFIRFTTSAFRKPLSIYVFSYFPFGFEGRMWDLIVSVPSHYLSFYFVLVHVLYFSPWWQRKAAIFDRGILWRSFHFFLWSTISETV